MNIDLNKHSSANIEPAKFDELFKKGCKEKHLLSQLYDSLLSSTSPSMQGIKAGWEQELDTEIDRDLWDKIT